MNFFQKIERTISTPRFDSYKLQGGSAQDALAKYLWNIALCESLYPVLHLIEVSYRNAAHAAISASPIGMDWLMKETPILAGYELAKIQEAKESLRKRRKTLNEPYLVSELNFGFWNSLLDARYERLWHKIIKSVFPHMPNSIRTRSELSSRMSGIRNLRNSALHHHSIWHWGDLQNKHAQIHELLGWICDSSARTAEQIDLFPRIYEEGAAGYLTTSVKISN